MRQGETAPKGSWTGNPQGGVMPPQPLLLPDPSTRFIATANRLEKLAEGHAMMPWLRFMAGLARAQHHAATRLPAFPILEQSLVERAVHARMPPLAADGHRRDPAWRDGLAFMLDSFEAEDLPAQASKVMTDLRRYDAATLESLADSFLAGGVAKADAGAALYVAAALQVYFTGSAALLNATSLRLLEERALCPCCGSPPVAGVVTASGPAPGTRYLYCSLCSTAWNHVRAICITCGSARTLALRGIEGGSEAVKAETCDECHTYVKTLYQKQDIEVDPFADDLASLGLDILVAEAGFARHAPNPLLLIG